MGLLLLPREYRYIYHKSELKSAHFYQFLFYDHVSLFIYVSFLFLNVKSYLTFLCAVNVLYEINIYYSKPETSKNG